MSQAGILSQSTSGPNIPTSFITDVNSPAVPIANIINVLGGSTTANDTDGIRTDGSSGLNILTIQTTNRLQGIVTTVGAVTGDAITFALGATPGSYSFEFNIAGFESTTPAGLAYTLTNGARTTGAAATILGTSDLIINREAALATATADLIASGNNVIVRITGVAGLTLNWRVLGTYIFVS